MTSIYEGGCSSPHPFLKHDVFESTTSNTRTSQNVEIKFRHAINIEPIDGISSPYLVCFLTSNQQPGLALFILITQISSEHSTCGWTLGAPVGIFLRGLGLGPEFRLWGPCRLAWELNPEVLAPIPPLTGTRVSWVLVYRSKIFGLSKSARCGRR